MRWLRIAFVLGLLVCFAPIGSVIAAAWIAERHGCVLHEGFVNPCVVNGKDIGETLYAMGVMGWLMLATLPIAALLVLAWIAIEIIIAIRRRRRQRA